MDQTVDAFIKTRVTGKTKTDFEDICATLAISPAAKMRELVESFVQRELGRRSDRLAIRIYRPTGYDFGVWRLKMSLRDPAEMTWNGAPIPFALPQLPKRRLHPDDGYLAVLPSDTFPIGGQFIKGVFEAHLYSNGIAEDNNPTSIDAMRKALAGNVTVLLNRFAEARNA